MPAHARDVAAALRERVPGLPLKKMHKLLYYCQAHHQATFGVPLFSESIMAWDMGPVVAQLWKAEHESEPQQESAVLDEAALNSVGYVVSRYGQLTGRDLENLTHSEAPWQRANADRRPGESRRIELEWIDEYFASDRDDEPDVVLDSGMLAAWLADATPPADPATSGDSPDELRSRLARRA